MTAATVTGFRRVRCVISHLHRDLGIAENACAGRFTHAGVTLDLGRCPDWLHDGMRDDVEWRIEFVKLYEGLDLAHSFAVTGDLDNLDTWQDLVVSFIDQVPVGHDSSDVSARRLQNWIYAAQMFAATAAFPGFRHGFEAMLIDRLSADLDHLRRHLTPERNHRTLEIYALLIAHLALGDLEPARVDLDLLADNAATDIWPDGVHRECSSDYHLIVLRSLVGAIANAHDAGLAVPPALAERTHRACDVAMWLHRPDGTTPALSDGDQSDFRELLRLAGQELDRDDLAWVASDGDAGTPPVVNEATFPHGGYLFWRTSWERPTPTHRPAWGVFDCGPIGDGGHGHYDQLSVELFEGDQGLVVDPGRYTYADGPDGWRHWFKGTAAHNTVTVDGLDHIRYRKGKPKGKLSEASLIARHGIDGLTTATARVWSPRYDAVHTRTVALVNDLYWVIHDTLVAPSSHEYAARWHLPADAWGATVARTTATETMIEAPGVRLLVPRWCGDVAIEAGWISPTYGVKQEAPVVVVRTTGAGQLDLCTVIGGSTTPDRIEAAMTDRGLAISSHRGRQTERLGWGPQGTGPWLEQRRS